MSTDRLIQFLDTTDAEGNALGPSVSNRREVETFHAGGTIAAGDWVMFDASKTGAARVAYVLQAPAVATKGNGAVIGCALEAAVAGDLIKVVTAGYHAAANVDGAVTAGDILVGPITVAGRADIEVVTGVNATTGKCGIALGADVGNFAPVCVVKVF
jgi:hypothetical protein